MSEEKKHSDAAATAAVIAACGAAVLLENLYETQKRGDLQLAVDSAATPEIKAAAQYKLDLYDQAAARKEAWNALLVIGFMFCVLAVFVLVFIAVLFAIIGAAFSYSAPVGVVVAMIVFGLLASLASEFSSK